MTTKKYPIKEAYNNIYFQDVDIEDGEFTLEGRKFIQLRPEKKRTGTVAVVRYRDADIDDEVIREAGEPNHIYMNAEKILDQL